MLNKLSNLLDQWRDLDSIISEVEKKTAGAHYVSPFEDLKIAAKNSNRRSKKPQCTDTNTLNALWFHEAL